MNFEPNAQHHELFLESPYFESDFSWLYLKFPFFKTKIRKKPKSHCLFTIDFESKQHYTLSSLKNILNYQKSSRFYKNAFKFAIIRNPWSRIVSEAKFLKKYGNLKNTETIHESIIELCRKKHIGNHRFDINQVDYISINGKIEVDEIIKLEELDYNFSRITDIIGLPLQYSLEHLNQSNEPSYKNYYTSETIELVRKKYQKDINEFDS